MVVCRYPMVTDILLTDWSVQPLVQTFLVILSYLSIGAYSSPYCWSRLIFFFPPVFLFFLFSLFVMSVLFWLAFHLHQRFLKDFFCNLLLTCWLFFYIKLHYTITLFTMTTTITVFFVRDSLCISSYFWHPFFLYCVCFLLVSAEYS